MKSLNRWTRLLYWFSHAIAYRVSASWGWKLERKAMHRHLRERLADQSFAVLEELDKK